MCFIIQVPIVLYNELDTLVLAKVADRVWLVKYTHLLGDILMMSINVRYWSLINDMLFLFP
jgi:hypothetical protein